MTVGVSLKVIAIALLDVMVDGMIVMVSTSRNRSLIQSLVYGFRFGGGMLCGWSAGKLIGGGVASFVQFYYIFSLLSLLAILPVLIFKSSDLEQARNSEDERLSAERGDHHGSLD